MTENIKDTANEADLAADYIEELLDIADLDGDIELGELNGRPYVSIASDNPEKLETLVGKDGETLLALQHLTRLSVGEQNETPASLLLDINGWRSVRVKQLEDIAKDAIDKVNSGEDTVHLASMNSFERKTVHDFVSSNGAFSHSEGFGRNRHIVVTKDEVVSNDADNADSNEEA